MPDFFLVIIAQVIQSLCISRVSVVQIRKLFKFLAITVKLRFKFTSLDQLFAVVKLLVLLIPNKDPKNSSNPQYLLKYIILFYTQGKYVSRA